MKSALVLTGCFLSFCVGASAQTATLPRVPLCTGLSIVTAISQKDGDYESIKTIVITDFKLLRSDPMETIDGHRCSKLVGEVGLAYGTGAVTKSRPTTIWIDAESLPVRKVLEDTSKNGAIDRLRTTFEPVADPKIDDAKFKFVLPTSK